MNLTERNFATWLRGAEMHWLFVQASQAARCELWLPATVTIITAIEQSIRVTMRQLAGQQFLIDDGLGATLSNSLLKKAHLEKLPVEKLAFPGETDFLSRIAAKAPLAEIVAVRHNLCHGNVLPWINRDLGDDMAFFTPECMRPLAQELIEIGSGWADALGSFRVAKGIA